VHQRNWSRPGAVLVLLVAGSLSACDNGATAPRFERPAGTIIGLDPTKRLASRELGGNQAMQEISNQMGSASITSKDPMERTVAEWRAKQGMASGASATKMWEGVELYDGAYYVWSGGNSYAPIGKDARIYNFAAQASKNGPDDPVIITAAFKFDGHRASNVAQWTLSRSTGENIRTRSPGNFGAQTDPFFGLTAFGARGWAASATEDGVGCDVRVNGDTRATAWYEGVWDQNGVSFGITPSGPTAGTNLNQRHAGDTEASKNLGTYFTCPPGNGDGGGGGYGGGLSCYVCQQWFSYNGEYFLEWWECGPVSMEDCWAT
jgi:hypothetical protein